MLNGADRRSPQRMRVVTKHPAGGLYRCEIGYWRRGRPLTQQVGGAHFSRNSYPFVGLGFMMTMLLARPIRAKPPAMAQINGILIICMGVSIPALKL